MVGTGPESGLRPAGRLTDRFALDRMPPSTSRLWAASVSILYRPSRLSLLQIVRQVGGNVGQRRHVRIPGVADDFFSIFAR